MFLGTDQGFIHIVLWFHPPPPPPRERLMGGGWWGSSGNRVFPICSKLHGPFLSQLSERREREVLNDCGPVRQGQWLASVSAEVLVPPKGWWPTRWAQGGGCVPCVAAYGYPGAPAFRHTPHARTHARSAMCARLAYVRWVRDRPPLLPSSHLLLGRQMPGVQRRWDRASVASALR